MCGQIQKSENEISFISNISFKMVSAICSQKIIFNFLNEHSLAFDLFHKHCLMRNVNERSFKQYPLSKFPYRKYSKNLKSYFILKLRCKGYWMVAVVNYMTKESALWKKRYFFYILFDCYRNNYENS